MENPIGEGIDLKVVKGRWGILFGLAEHMVPLQDLMQHDPIDEPAQAHTQQDARTSNWAPGGRSMSRHRVRVPDGRGRKLGATSRRRGYDLASPGTGALWISNKPHRSKNGPTKRC